MRISVSGQYCLSHLPQSPSTNEHDRQLLGQELCSYFNEYSRTFIESHENITMRFQVEVEKLWRQDERQKAWKLRTKKVGDLDAVPEVMAFDKVVLCTGVRNFKQAFFPALILLHRVPAGLPSQLILGPPFPNSKVSPFIPRRITSILRVFSRMHEELGLKG